MHVFAFFLFFSILIGCSSEPATRSDATAATENKAPADWEGTTIGFALAEAGETSLLAARNEDLSFVPASLIKVVPAIFGLTVLGGDHRFKTSVFSEGRVVNGKLKGNLYIVGGGDPMLLAPDLMSLAQKVVQKGIQTIEGGLYYDDSLYISSEAIDSGMGMEFPYNPGISALSSDFNQWILFQPKPGRENAFALPQIPYTSKDLHVRLEGQNPSSANQQEMARRIPVKTPGQFTVDSFAQFLRMCGVQSTEPRFKKLVRSASVKKVAEHHSLPLIEIVDKMLEHSNNSIAELIGLAAARKVSGRSVSISDSAKIAETWLRQKVSIQDPAFSILTGSGLGNQNRVNPRTMVRILDGLESLSCPDRCLSSLLPISGWKGALSQRLRSPDTALRIWAKTGTHNFVSTLGGYVYTAKGRKLRFVIFITNESLQQQFGGTADTERSRAWRELARNYQDQLLEDWLATF